MSKSFKKDLTGQRFGRLTVLEFVPTTDNESHWKCQCNCGNYVIAKGKHLKEGNTKSCGCFRKTHGKTDTRLYNIWTIMKRRCFAESNFEYDRYGGRGITVCDEWKDDFQAFYDWSMANGYEDNLTIDRIDNNGNYEPLNCRWSNLYTQGRNKRNNVIVCYKGENMCLTEAAELCGIQQKTLFQRYYRGDRGERLFRPLRNKNI